MTTDDDGLGDLDFEPEKEFDRLKALVRCGLDFLAEEDPELSERISKLQGSRMYPRPPGQPWHRITISDGEKNFHLFDIHDVSLQKSSDRGLIKYGSGRELEIEILDAGPSPGT